MASGPTSEAVTAHDPRATSPLMRLPYHVRIMVLHDVICLPDHLHYWCYCQEAPDGQDTNRLHDNVEHDMDMEDSDGSVHSDDSRASGEGRYTLEVPCAYGTNCELKKRGAPVRICCGQCLPTMDSPGALCLLCREQIMRCWLALMQTNKQLNEEVRHLFMLRGFNIRIFRSTVRFGQWIGEQALERMKALHIWRARFIRIEVHEWDQKESVATLKAVCDALQGVRPGAKLSALKIHIYISCDEPKASESLPSPMEARFWKHGVFKEFSNNLASVRTRKLQLASELYDHCQDWILDELDVRNPHVSEQHFDADMDRKPDSALAHGIFQLFCSHFRPYVPNMVDSAS